MRRRRFVTRAAKQRVIVIGAGLFLLFVASWLVGAVWWSFTH
jgi:hypothetical protein